MKNFILGLLVVFIYFSCRTENISTINTQGVQEKTEKKNEHIYSCANMQVPKRMHTDIRLALNKSYKLETIDYCAQTQETKEKRLSGMEKGCANIGGNFTKQKCIIPNMKASLTCSKGSELMLFIDKSTDGYCDDLFVIHDALEKNSKLCGGGKIDTTNLKKFCKRRP